MRFEYTDSEYAVRSSCTLSLRVLPGLGIPSDVGVLADPVSIGDSVRSRHGDLLVMCLGIVTAHSGDVHHPLFASPVMPLGSHCVVLWRNSC